MQASWTPTDCLDALGGGTPLLFPTPAAARRLRRAFDLRQTACGHRGWQPAPALAWSQWTSSAWNDLVVSGAETRLLLNGFQELHLWREIIAADTGAKTLLASVDSLAELCRSAWSLACSFQCTGELRRSATTHDSRVFAAWAEEFSRRCADRDLLSHSGLETALAAHVRSGALPPPVRLHLVGFDEHRPAQSALLDALSARGTEIVEIVLSASQPETSLRAHAVVPDHGAEMRAAALWIRDAVFEQIQPVTGESGQAFSAALLVPGSIEALRGDLESVFRDVLTPELQPVTTDLSSTPWEFSSGPPLASTGLVSDLLELCRWASGPLPLERVSALVLSPFLEHGASAVNARFDAFGLREASVLRPEFDLNQVARLALTYARKRGISDPADQPIPWVGKAAEVAAVSGCSDAATQRSHADWTEVIRRLAKAAGWPGPRSLTAAEFEITRAWDSVLDLLATLDFSAQRVTFRDALAGLERATRSTPAPAPTGRPLIHVMSLEEAEGQVFDAAVILGATDTAWPAPEAMNPLLGWPLQRRLGMPGSDPAKSAINSLTRAQGLVRRCKSLLVLQPAEEATGPTRPSPLIAQLGIPLTFPEALFPPQPESPPVPNQVIPDLEPLPALPAHEVHGGAHLLKLQAACGFLAFSERRLGAKAPEASTPGLDPRESGNVLHLALQLFWKEVGSQERLRKLPEVERVQLLSDCISQALDKAPHPQGSWDQAYLAVTAQRLQRVLLAWLHEELERRVPFVVLEQEHSTEVQVGPLTLHVRVDRVDSVGQDEDTGILVIDYKTGHSADTRSWTGPRPDEPQLPLYALLAEPGELRGVAFARVRAGGEKRWAGYIDDPALLPRKGSKVLDLESETVLWREALADLAADFYNGRADVRPKSFAQNCGRCAHRLLCRVDPAALEAAAIDDESEEVEAVHG